MSAKVAAKEVRNGVSSRTSFQYLDVDSGEEEEEEVMVPSPDVATVSLPPIKPPTIVVEEDTGPKPPPTKAQLKRANKKQLKAKTSFTSDPEPTQLQTQNLPPPPPPADEMVAEVLETPIRSPVENVAVTPTAEPLPVPPRPRSASRGRPSSINAEPAFQPELPDSLPTPKTVKVERKRKASTELTSNPLTKESKVELIRENGDVTTVPVTIQITSSADGPAAQNELAERAKKRANVGVRTFWSLVMIGGFITLLCMGPSYMILLVIACQTIVYREVTALFGLAHPPEPTPLGGKKRKDPWSKTLNWYFFAVTNYFLYGESMIYYFKHVIFSDVAFVPFATNHRFISFMLYMFGFMGFVMSLKNGYLRRQFGLFCWVHMTLLVVVVSSHFIVDNILEGMIWFWVPASLVICNDCFAYIWGVTIGRTPLFKLSPKKTVEGFVGAFISTVIFSVLWGTLFMRWSYMICPIRDLGTSAWTAQTCTPNPVFIWREYTVPTPVRLLLSSLLNLNITTISYARYQFHVLVMATFASLVAPFGGFFASGFKRAFDLKDFGQSIPGHGGMTDRMDCQFIMGMFSYVYYSSLIRVHTITVGSVLQTIASSLTLEDQLILLADLKRLVEGQMPDSS